jgi:hypothetical protein
MSDPIGVTIDADEALRSAREFLTVPMKVDLPVADSLLPEIQRDAETEARSALEAGTGHFQLDKAELTPGMRRLVRKLVAKFEPWTAECSRQLSLIDINETAVRSEITARRTTTQLELTAERDRRIAQLRGALANRPDYRANRREFDIEQARFQQLLTLNDGKYPRHISVALYSIAIIIIVSSDWAINYETFLNKFALYGAVVATAAIAAVIGWAAHFHGKTLKQYRFTFREFVNPATRKSTRLFLRIVSVLFIIALGVVTWARYSYLAEQSGIDSYRGLLSEQAWDILISKVSPTLVFNILIWFLGLVISYVVHEKVPDLRETADNLRRLDRGLVKLSKDTETEIEIIQGEHQIKSDGNRRELTKKEEKLIELTAIKKQLEDARRGYEEQVRVQLRPILARYAGFFSDAVRQLDGDESSLVLDSPGNGVLTLSQFRASEFSLSSL